MPRTPLSKEFILSILDVDILTGTCRWKNVSKYHESLNGIEAGGIQRHRGGDRWLIGINGEQYRRAYIVFVVAKGYWPELIDHIDGNSLNDSISNIREATITQNSWNHRTRAKKSDLPMGVRLNCGKYTARIGYNKTLITIGTFEDVHSASAAYRSKRVELFGEFSAICQSS